MRVQQPGDLPGGLRALGLAANRPVIVLVGGAGGLDDAEYDRLRPLFTESIAPLAEAVGAAVIDGGTASGIMALIGEARTVQQRAFPLIGVAVEQQVTWPGRSPGEDAARRTALDPHHSHFFLVPGKDWGEESEWIFQTADVLAGSSPSVTVLINGGEIAYQDVALSLQHRRQVILVAGSGRTTDVIVQRLQDAGIEPGRQQAANTGFFTVSQMEQGPADLTSQIKRSLNIKEG